MKNTQINRAARLLIIKSKDYILNSSFLFIFFVVYGISLKAGFFDKLSEDLLLMFLWALIFGIGIIISNSMIVDITFKDKLKKRLEFFLANGINPKKYIQAYSIEMWRLSSIIPYLIFLLTYFIYNFSIDLKWILLLFISTIGLNYFIILSLNLLALDRSNYKLFKMILFSITTVIIYMLGNFSKQILIFLSNKNINLIFLLIKINLSLILAIGILSFIKLNKISKEKIITKEGRWT